jgi:hypothetical protein
MHQPNTKRYYCVNTLCDTNNEFKVLFRLFPEGLMNTMTIHRVVCVPAEVRTVHLLNTCQKRYRLSQLAVHTPLNTSSCFTSPRSLSGADTVQSTVEAVAKFPLFAARCGRCFLDQINATSGEWLLLTVEHTWREESGESDKVWCEGLM